MLATQIRQKDAIFYFVSYASEDLLEKVRYYLDHPEEADAIRKAGQQKVRQYTWDKIWPGLIARVIRFRQ